MENNAHVTMIRIKKKALEQQSQFQDQHEGEHQKTYHNQHEKQPYLATPTRRGQVRRVIKSDDSIDIPEFNLWMVSDESFLQEEESCQSPNENRKVGELTEKSNDTTTTNVFQMKRRKGFYDFFNSPTSSVKDHTADKTMVNKDAKNINELNSSLSKPSTEGTFKGKENSINLMRFDSLDKPSTTLPACEGTNNNIMDESYSLNLSVEDNISHQFNETLEAVDYFMEQGKKILNRTCR